MTLERVAGRQTRSGSEAALPATKTAPLLVATDGTESADSAVRVAAAIARRTGQRVEVLAVQEPLPIVAPELHFAIGPAAESDARSALRLQVLEQLIRTDIRDRWPVEVLSGQPAATIANAAQRIGAALVIMGLGEHGLYDRLLGDEMALRVIRLGTVPVLAVAAGSLGLPTRVLAATDFSPSSVRAVGLAESILTPFGTLTLAHSVLDEEAAADWKRTHSAHHGTIGHAMDVIASGLSRDDVKLERDILTGDPAEELLRRAAALQADLIATGSHGHGFLTRLWLGSVSQQLVRGARCSVLVAPPEGGPGYVEEMPETMTRYANFEWAERLEEFTRRNERRQATLEIIDPELGAQVENHAMPLLGVDFDSRDQTVHVMLGEAGLEGPHLTRTIRGVSAIQVLRERGGMDVMLRVAHGRGQTLLTFAR